jgi:hypothetical protein
VLQAQRLFGDPDYLLRVLAVMKHVVGNRPLPA